MLEGEGVTRKQALPPSTDIPAPKPADIPSKSTSVPEREPLEEGEEVEAAAEEVEESGGEAGVGESVHKPLTAAKKKRFTAVTEASNPCQCYAAGRPTYAISTPIYAVSTPIRAMFRPLH